MKHFFTLIFICLSAVLTAQSLQIRSATGASLEGQTVVHSGLSTDAEVVATGYYLHNIGSTTIGVRCKRFETSVVSGTQNALCWAACSSNYTAGVQPTLVAPGGSLTMAPGDSINLFVLHYYPMNLAGTSLFKVTFYNAAIASDTTVFNVQFDVATSVAEVAAKSLEINAYPNPANNFITIDVVNLGEKATLRIIDALGVTVKTASINGDANLKFSIADLREGVYFYSLMTSNKTIVTRRMIITH